MMQESGDFPAQAALAKLFSDDGHVPPMRPVPWGSVPSFTDGILLDRFVDGYANG